MNWTNCAFSLSSSRICSTGCSAWVSSSLSSRFWSLVWQFAYPIKFSNILSENHPSLAERWLSCVVNQPTFLLCLRKNKSTFVRKITTLRDIKIEQFLKNFILAPCGESTFIIDEGETEAEQGEPLWVRKGKERINRGKIRRVGLNHAGIFRKSQIQINFPDFCKYQYLCWISKKNVVYMSNSGYLSHFSYKYFSSRKGKTGREVFTSSKIFNIQALHIAMMQHFRIYSCRISSFSFTLSLSR